MCLYILQSSAPSHHQTEQQIQFFSKLEKKLLKYLLLELNDCFLVKKG